jgi:hypothetical protein
VITKLITDYCRTQNDIFRPQKFDVLHELQVLEASARPSYLLASARRGLTTADGVRTRVDPIRKSFRLLSICYDLVTTRNKIIDRGTMLS